MQRLGDERQQVCDLLERLNRPDPVLESLTAAARQRHQEVEHLNAERPGLERQIQAAEDDIEQAEATAATARGELDNAVEKVRRTTAHLQAETEAAKLHQAMRPSWMKRMGLWMRGQRGVYKNWTARARELQQTLHDFRSGLQDAENHCATCESAVHQHDRKLGEAKSALHQSQDQLARLNLDVEEAIDLVRRAERAVDDRKAELRLHQQELDAARLRWPGTVPGPEWSAEATDRQALEQREKSSPWMDEEFAAARSRLFLAALNLHRAVLTSEPQLVRSNLFGAMDVVKGVAPDNLSRDTVLAAWQMLFFIVPVVSTTFASIPTMFKSLGREALGWLFIDEAGQATPQAAVGGIWRAQRVVVVGDPRQLEPVITLPASAQERLNHHFEVDDQWSPRGSSVQTISDRTNRFGMWLPNSDREGQTWVGSPLRVHRRCDRLMFSVSNAIAYDGTMVYGVTRKAEFDLLEKNLWFDVPAVKGGGKWNEHEGAHVLDTLKKLRTGIQRRMRDEVRSRPSRPPGWTVSDEASQAELQRRLEDSVFVVSPFRDVTSELRKYLRKNGIRLSPSRLGTIHTTQGKEADVVILVLGTSADEDGARNWASSTPNLLNVAVTRARRRLVVVGDYKAWSKLRHFQVLARTRSEYPNGSLTVIDAG
ncbi:DEAD/DEAH box helicase [Nocardia sp. N2S4-5]|uniref:DEAD/DEAH box helicase n=1 Tax=Nocardia sp. N2S4-5 TaxID=3351565 RepID=UPI0037D68592